MACPHTCLADSSLILDDSSLILAPEALSQACLADSPIRVNDPQNFLVPTLADMPLDVLCQSASLSRLTE